MTPVLVRTLGDELYAALKRRQATSPLSERGLGLTIDEAYDVQARLVERHLAEGEIGVGYKVGLTSSGARAALKAEEPSYGRLFSSARANSGDELALSRFIAPKVEGELAFLLKRDLAGPGIGVADVLGATEGVLAAFEIVDSRITDWRIGVADMIADNGASSAFVLGDRLVDIRDVDLRLCGMVLEKNGEVATTGAGAMVLGSPANAVAWLANALARRGHGLKAGDIVLSGSLGALTPVAAGDNLRCTVGGVGDCSIRFGA